MDKPEALRLANLLDPFGNVEAQAAAELRRLHAENETLRKQHLDAHRNSGTIFAALREISLLTPLGGEVAEYEDVVEAVREMKALIAACEPYLKEGETPAERIERERRDTEAVWCRLYAKEREKNVELLEALKLALSAHGVMLLSDPPQEAWKTYGVEQKARAAIARAEGEKT